MLTRLYAFGSYGFGALGCGLLALGLLLGGQDTVLAGPQPIAGDCTTSGSKCDGPNCPTAATDCTDPITNCLCK